MFLKKVDVCLAIGKLNKQYWAYYGVPEEKIHTTLHAVDNKRFSETSLNNTETISALRKSWSIKGGDVAFVYSGNLQVHKAVDVLISAFLQVNKSEPNTHLIIVGDGEERKNLELIASDNSCIHFVGFVNQQEIPIYLAVADVLVLPSKREAWGLVVNEAMAVGLPCIVSSDVGAAPDMVSENNTGLVFKTDDINELIEKMKISCNSKKRNIWMSNIPKVLKKASLEDNVRVIVDCMTVVTKGTNR